MDSPVYAVELFYDVLKDEFYLKAEDERVYVNHAQALAIKGHQTTERMYPESMLNRAQDIATKALEAQANILDRLCASLTKG